MDVYYLCGSLLFILFAYLLFFPLLLVVFVVLIEHLYDWVLYFLSTYTF